MKHKRNCFSQWLFISVLALILSLSASAYAQATTCVIPLDAETTHSLLLKNGEDCYLVGGSDAAAIQPLLNKYHAETITAVIAACTHEEHIAALSELTEHFQSTFISLPDSPVLENLELIPLEKGIQIVTSSASYAFGVDTCVDGSISFDCSGNMLSFSATTDEASVNVRSDTSTKSDRVAKLTRGSFVTASKAVINENGELWYQVSLEDGTTGYIRSDLIKCISEAERAVQVQQQSEAKKETRYIGNKKSKVFHSPNCKSLPASKNQVYFDSRDYAVSKGYRPCKNCKP